MSTRKFIIHISIYAVLFAVLAKGLPWYVFGPLSVLIVTIHQLFESRRLRRKYHGVLEGIRNLQGDSTIELSELKATDVDQTIYKAFKEVVAELERKNFQLVEKNIQLLSLKEIGLTLVSSPDEAKVVDAVINFLSKGLGFRELFVGIYNGEAEGFNFYVFRDTADGHSYDQRTLPLERLDGMMQKAVRTHQSLLIRDPEMHPIGTASGEELFENTTMNSYVIVPLVKSNATQGCGQRRDCILNMKPPRTAGKTGLAAFRCDACKRIPILGVIGVTDGFKAATLSKVDLVSVETLAVQISTMLENTRLFEELKNEEGFRDNIINSMMTGLITCDSDGRIMLANVTAQLLTDYDEEELKEMNVKDVLGAGKKDGENPVLQTIRTGRVAYQEEAWFIKKDGSTHPIILNTSFLLDEAKNVQGVLAVFIDISRIKRMEEQIMHLDKLAALGRFSSSIAHEIRNPLAGIAAGIQYLKRAGQVQDRQQENINFILEEVTRIDRLIGDLMNVVRVSDLIYEDTQIESIIKNSIASMHDLAEKKTVEIVTEFPEEARPVSVDADRITQVMINLLKNAIEASHAGDRVLVRVSFPLDVSDVLFDAVQDFVIIEVKDSGLGIQEEDRQQIFEPFFSKKTGGTGLGLYVTHSIVDRHGGYIYVDSEYGVGTTFSVYLPVEQVQHGGTSEVSYPVSG